MIPYILLILISTMFCFVVFEKKAPNTLSGYVGNNEYIKLHNSSDSGFFLGLFLLLSLRSIKVGSDTGVYLITFDSIRSMAFSDLKNHDVEVLYKLLNWLVGKITDNFQWFLAAVSAITVFPIMSLYNEEREHSYLKIILFVNMTTFVMLFSGIRQSVAFAIGTIAYKYVRKKKLIAYLICVIIAIGFHHSAFVLLAMYPLYHITIKRKHLFFAIPIITLAFIFNEQIFKSLLFILSSYSDEYSDITISETGAITSFVLFIMFAVFAYLIPDEEKIDKEIIGLRNLLLLTVILQIFAMLHPLAMRMNYYYIIFVPILIPKILSVASERYKQVAIVAKIVLCVFFTFYFVSYLYTAYKTGSGALNTVPYVPFWSE